MSRSEDYLDNLLTSVTDQLSEFDEDFEQNRESLKESYQTQNDLPSKTQSALDEIREENFLREFEDELHKSGSDDSFLRDFERELNGEADDAYQSPQTDDYITQMGDIANDTRTDADDVTMKIDTMPQLDQDLESLFQDTADLGTDVSAQNSGSGGGWDSDSGSGQQTDSGLDTSTDAGWGSGPDIDFNSLNDVTALDDETAGSLNDGLNPAADADIGQTQALAADTGTGEEGFSQMAKEQEQSAAPKGMEGLEDIFGDLFDEETASLLEELGADDIDMPADTAAAKEKPADDSLTQILSESDDAAISELNGTQNLQEETAAANPDDSIPMGPDFSYEESAINIDDADKKKKKEKNPNSPFAKLSRLLFGTPEELDPQAAAEYEAAKAAMGQSEELDAKARREKKKQEKELKKQQKQEEAEKKKQEKEAAKAEKAAKKASKPKKEKKPKQKDKMPKEPPLPKVPVTMMWIIALSMMVLIFLGTVLLGYSVPVSESKEAFDNGDYVTAYAKLGGVKIKPEDESLLHASAALAAVQTELDAYTALMEQRQYEMALDALIRGYGRCAVHSADAEEWGVAQQMADMESKLDLLLKEQFDVSKRKAKKLYSIKKRSDYTMELHQILDKLGLSED